MGKPRIAFDRSLNLWVLSIPTATATMRYSAVPSWHEAMKELRVLYIIYGNGQHGWPVPMDMRPQMLQAKL